MGAGVLTHCTQANLAPVKAITVKHIVHNSQQCIQKMSHFCQSSYAKPKLVFTFHELRDILFLMKRQTL